MLTRLARWNRHEEGFTLIELLVVVAIIGLLTAFAVPRLFDAINTSKKAAGQSDMGTISGALERHYMDKSGYPTDTDADPDTALTEVKKNLLGTYLKAGTKLQDGFSRGYLYQTNKAGSYYLLVDPSNVSVTGTHGIVVACGLTPAPVNSVPPATPTAAKWASSKLTLNVGTTTTPAELSVAISANFTDNSVTPAVTVVEAGPTTSDVVEGCFAFNGDDWTWVQPVRDGGGAITTPAHWDPPAAAADRVWVKDAQIVTN